MQKEAAHSLCLKKKEKLKKIILILQCKDTQEHSFQYNIQHLFFMSAFEL